MIRRPPRSTHCISSAASDVYKRQALLGAEYQYNDQFTGRIGYKTNASDWKNGGSLEILSGISAGVGFNWHYLGLDYAYISYGDLGSVNQISLRYRFQSKDRPNREGFGLFIFHKYEVNVEYKDILLEIGLEELPASYIIPAIEKLTYFFKQQLSDAHLVYSEIVHFSTPRRLAMIIRNLQTQQADEQIEKIGPAVHVAYKQEGVLSPAGEGFVRNSGVGKENITIKTTPKGDYIAVVIEKKGLSASEILQDLIPKSIFQIQFPKQMRWGSQETSYARAVRWIIALSGEEIIPVHIFDLSSNRITYGNRFQKLENRIEISSPSHYEESLEKVFVIADREKRKQSIQSQLDSMFVGTDLHVVPDHKLLDIVVDLVEYPTAVSATFDVKYLALPEKIITSTISENQKYFAVESANGPMYSALIPPVSYTHLRAHETRHDLVCRLLLEKKKNGQQAKHQRQHSTI
eukprot:TRINITY_DN30709_c0_g1_i1.p1 TRINITY_DN30709_c0_g1~~TRINITY_DN30709_c0_g1_i1.p1  ORF type:complete len:462 (-),score=36.85 TRINITY_DN30709_c0_g1_i1:10-1395(-)